MKTNGIAPVKIGRDYSVACGLMAVMVGAVLLCYLLYLIASWVML